MSHVLTELTERGIARPPKWLPSNTMYLTVMGSVAYGVSGDSSDYDVYGFVIPPKDEIFPHLRGEIRGFGTQKQRFGQYQQHHLHDPDALGGHGRSYDFSVYNIVDYFQLCLKNNPNVIDSLFTPDNCVLHNTQVGQLVRERRKGFLHKGCWHTFKGYAYSQVSKMSGKNRTGKRAETIAEHGYDVKFAYHVVRLLNEVEQIMTEGDLDLQRNREQLKSIRRGEWTEQEVRDYFSRKEAELESLYQASTLPWGPDEPAIKQLLLDCLELHYGSLETCVVNPDAAVLALREVAAVLERHRRLL